MTIPYEAIVEASRAINDDVYVLLGWEGITRILEAAAPHMPTDTAVEHSPPPRLDSTLNPEYPDGRWDDL